MCKCIHTHTQKAKLPCVQVHAGAKHIETKKNCAHTQSPLNPFNAISSAAC